jgi:2-methylisocitrate lyase-like PEP mutase family enzyme
LPRIASSGTVTVFFRRKSRKQETQHDIQPTRKADRFRALHQELGFFVIANAWDAGSARVLVGLGFQALATSSGASAGVLGRRDGMVTRQEALDHAIVAATDLPVSADLEKGFDDARRALRRRYVLPRLSAGSIEDFSGNPQKPLFDLSREPHAPARAAGVRSPQMKVEAGG